MGINSIKNNFIKCYIILYYIMFYISKYLQKYFLYFITLFYKIQYYILLNPISLQLYKLYELLFGIQYLNVNDIYFINLDDQNLIKKIDLSIVKELLKFNEEKIDKNNYILLDYTIKNTDKYNHGVLNGNYYLIINCKLYNLYILLDYILNFKYYFKKCINDTQYITLGENYLECNVLTTEDDISIDITNFYNKLLGPDKNHHKFLSLDNHIQIDTLFEIYKLYDKQNVEKYNLKQLILLDYDFEYRNFYPNDNI